MFVGRKKELLELENLIATSKFEFGLIYGRRQVGKTSLLQEIIKKHKGFYFMADRTSILANCKRLSLQITQYLKEPSIIFENFYDLFHFIVKRLKRKKIVFVIDEFSYLVDKNFDFLTILQNIVDNILKNTRIKLFISGSHMSLMEQMDNYNQALYRRVNYKKKLQPFSYDEAALFYPNMNNSDKIRLYSIFGGIPYYLNQIDDSKSVKDNIIKISLPEIDLTENEIYTNLLQEIRMPAPYLEILDFLGDKKEVKITTISKIIEKSTAHTSILLKKLLNLEIVYKVICFGEKENPKKTFYRIQDPFIRFYYRFIKEYYRKKYYFQNKEDFYQKIIASHLEHFVSWEFENICQRFLLKKYHVEAARFLYQKKNENLEIDLLCQTKEGLKAFECKWINKIIDFRNIYQLEEKVNKIKRAKRQDITQQSNQLPDIIVV